MRELPSGWNVVAIGDVTVPKVPQGAPEEKSTFTYVDISSVDNAAKRIVGSRPIAGKDAPSRARQHLAHNDVLVSMTRPNLNAVAKVPDNLDKAIGSTGFDVLRCKEIEPDWIFYTVRSPAFVQAMSDLVQGALYPAVRSEDVRSYLISLPPLNEQRRIVAKLDALFEKSRSIREKLDLLPRLLANLQKSILNSAFRGDLTKEWRANNPDVEPASELLKRICAERRALWEAELIARGKDPKTVKYVEPEPVDSDDLPELPQGWCWSRMNLVGKVQLGRQRTPKYHHGNCMRPYLRVQNVFENRIDTDDVMEMDFPDNDFETYRLKDGDILLNEGQSPEFLGRPAMYRGEVPDACFTNTLIRFQAKLGIDSEFALLVFRHYMHSGRFRGEGQITTNIAHLGAGRFAAIEFPLPPHKEQLEIVRLASISLQKTETLKNLCLQVAERHQQSEQAFLIKAFRGDLVPQDPNDEPASVLLERIRAQKPAAGTKRGHARRHAAPEGP